MKINENKEGKSLSFSFFFYSERIQLIFFIFSSEWLGREWLIGQPFQVWARY